MQFKVLNRGIAIKQHKKQMDKSGALTATRVLAHGVLEAGHLMRDCIAEETEDMHVAGQGISLEAVHAAVAGRVQGRGRGQWNECDERAIYMRDKRYEMQQTTTHQLTQTGERLSHTQWAAATGDQRWGVSVCPD